MENTSTPVATCSLKPPFSRFGTPHANSTFSRPRETSPRASETTLPCSADTSDAISFRLAEMSSRKLNITSARRVSDVARHAGNAAAATATAASTSAVLARSTELLCWPEAGLYTLASRPEVPGTTVPLIQCEMRFIATIRSVGLACLFPSQLSPRLLTGAPKLPARPLPRNIRLRSKRTRRHR
jgi:hypothetical protein